MAHYHSQLSLRGVGPTAQCDANSGPNLSKWIIAKYRYKVQNHVVVSIALPQVTCICLDHVRE